MAGEGVEGGGGVDDDVDQRFGPCATDRGGDVVHEDLVHRVEPAMLGAACQRMGECIITVQVAAGCAVALELGLAGEVEGLFHLDRTNRVTTRGVHVDGAPSHSDRRGAMVLVERLVVERPVGVSHRLEVGDRDGEVGVVELFGLLGQQRRELTKSFPGDGMPGDVGEQVDLSGTDPTGTEQVADFGVQVAQSGAEADLAGFGRGTVQPALQVAVGRTVSGVVEELPGVDDRGDCRDLQISGIAAGFRGGEGGVEFVDRRPGEVVDQGCEHVSDSTARTRGLSTR